MVSCVPDKVVFTAEKSSESDLEQDIGAYRRETKFHQRSLDENSIPQAEEEIYLEVHPTFLSTVGGQRTLEALEQASKLPGFAVKTNDNDWSVRMSTYHTIPVLKSAIRLISLHWCLRKKLQSEYSFIDYQMIPSVSTFIDTR